MTYAISIRQGNVRMTCRLDYLTNGGPCRKVLGDPYIVGRPRQSTYVLA